MLCETISISLLNSSIEKNSPLSKLMIIGTNSVNNIIKECDSVIGSHKRDFSLGYLQLKETATGLEG